MAGPMSLAYVKRLVQRKRIRELEGITPWLADETLMRLSASKWKDICFSSFENIAKILRAIVELHCQQRFNRFRSSNLLEDVRSAFFMNRTKSRTESLRILETVAKETRNLISAYCKWEIRRPYTQNNDDFLARRHTYFTSYINSRRPEQTPDTEHPANVAMVGNEAPEQRRVPENMLTPQYIDEHEQEILVIAEVLAYYEVSYKRVIDVIPMLIENEFLHKFSVQLTAQLAKNLELTGDMGLERCEKYVVEDDDMQNLRKTLQNKKDVLEEATKILRGLN